MQYGIKFVMYGENQAEAHNEFEENLTSLMDKSHFTSDTNPLDLYLGGLQLRDWVKEEMGFVLSIIIYQLMAKTGTTLAVRFTT